MSPAELEQARIDAECAAANPRVETLARNLFALAGGLSTWSTAGNDASAPTRHAWRRQAQIILNRIDAVDPLRGGKDTTR